MLIPFPKPYYAVIFSSQRTETGAEAYEQMAAKMLELAASQPGYLGVESVRDPSGAGITVSYWESEESIKAWREHVAHLVAQSRGRTEWYASFTVRICKIERDYDFQKIEPVSPKGP
jgi:heme-degrading monooxygenase HmoA